MNDEMKKLRDEMADEFREDCGVTQRTDASVNLTFGYKKGFDACDKLWREKTAKLVEAWKPINLIISRRAGKNALKAFIDLLAEFEVRK